MEIVAIVAVSLVVVYGMLKLADKVFLDKPKAEPEVTFEHVPEGFRIKPRKWTDEEIAFHEGPDVMGTGHGARRRKDKVDLRYDPLAVDEGFCCHGPVKIGPPGDDVPAVTEEQAEEYLNRLRAEIRASGKRYDPLKDEWVPTTKCLVCGDPMKREANGIETCDCPGRGYQPRS